MLWKNLEGKFDLNTYLRKVSLFSLFFRSDLFRSLFYEGKYKFWKNQWKIFKFFLLTFDLLWRKTISPHFRSPQRLGFGPKFLKIYIWPSEPHCLKFLIADFRQSKKEQIRGGGRCLLYSVHSGNRNSGPAPFSSLLHQGFKPAAPFSLFIV
jgi:hypothetical protein